MSNSFKYMKDHGEKELKIYSEKSEEGVVLHILDNGIGIPKRDLSRVFNKSFTGENGRKYAKQQEWVSILRKDCASSLDIK